VQPECEVVLQPERLVVRIGDQESAVTRTQFRLLTVLVGEPERVFGRQELVDRVIGTVVTPRTIDAHIKELRRKLGRHGAPIQTGRGSGYQYEPRRQVVDSGPGLAGA